MAASLLMLQMVIWMQRHGRSMKRELEQAAAVKATTCRFGLMLLAALAVGREGLETVVFLTGIIQQADSLGAFWG